MSEENKEQKLFKVYFNGLKKEEIASSGAKFSKFINNLIRPYSKVIKIIILIIFLILIIDSFNKKRI